MYHSGKKQNIIETAPSNIVKPVPVSRDEKAKFVEPYRCRHLHSDKSEFSFTKSIIIVSTFHSYINYCNITLAQKI